jgi:hypothetical protein
MFGLSKQFQENGAIFGGHVKLQHRVIVRDIPLDEEGIFLHRRVSSEMLRNGVVCSVTVVERIGGVYPRKIPTTIS